MSKTPDATDATPTTVVETPVEKQSFLKKMNPLPHIKKHPKIATAVGLGVVLIGAAATFGGNDEPTDEPSPESMEEAEAALVEFGIPVTDEN